MSPQALHEIRRAVHDELAEIEQMCAAHGSYTCLCEAPGSGVVVLAHKAFGRVLRRF